MKHYTPQIIMIVFMAWNACLNVLRHGEPRKDKYDAWGALFISLPIQVGLLWWGGFWK